MKYLCREQNNRFFSALLRGLCANLFNEHIMCGCCLAAQTCENDGLCGTEGTNKIKWNDSVRIFFLSSLWNAPKRVCVFVSFILHRIKRINERATTQEDSPLKSVECQIVCLIFVKYSNPFLYIFWRVTFATTPSMAIVIPAVALIAWHIAWNKHSEMVMSLIIWTRYILCAHCTLHKWQLLKIQMENKSRRIAVSTHSATAIDRLLNNKSGRHIAPDKSNKCPFLLCHCCTFARLSIVYLANAFYKLAECCRIANGELDLNTNSLRILSMPSIFLYCAFAVSSTKLD